ncbi:MAG: outer membrane beta-barrel protein [Acidobacteriota bacterium]|nr:outer membrane beta-barrel protein [Acidobacteriota bacterium]
MMSNFKKRRWRNMLLAATAAVATAAPAYSQSASKNAAKPYSTEGEYSTWDIGGFFGTQWFQMFQSNFNRSHELLARPVVGIRVTQDVGRYFGIEESLGVAFNRLALLPTGRTSFVTVSQRDYQFDILGMAYLTPRTSRFRPYVEFGPAGAVYQPGDANKITPAALALIPRHLRTKIEPGFVYGVGIKMPLSHRWETRIDLRGMWTPDPNFGLPSVPGALGQLYVTQHHGASGLQFTSGLSYRFGFHEPAPPPPPPPPPAPKAFASLQVSAIQGGHDVCPGDNLTLTVNASGWLPEQTPGYQWTVNGQSAPGATGTSFNLPTSDGSGSKSVAVTVTAGDQSKTSDPVNVTVRTLAPPAVRFEVSPTSINYGDKLPLSAQATGSDCGGAVTIRYSASEGTIAGDTFDSSGVSFDMSNRLKQQSKVVHLTATATDTKNQTGSAGADVTVNLRPEASRRDIVFANRSARVNNAAKRYLIEQLTPQLRADPGSSVILIGHRDMSEGNNKAVKALDRQRVLNTAGVLSAGKGVCPSLDLSRIQVAEVGTDQTNPPMPFADSSVKERTGQGVTDQRAQYRRVEVWLVPGGADKPAVSGVGAAPERELKALGCPR